MRDWSSDVCSSDLGYNALGGGFVGGLVFATAIILQYIVSGVVWVELRLRILPLS